MSICGIPKFMKNLVLFIMTTPRICYFKNEGVLKLIGQPTSTPGYRCVKISTGVLMGDPMTKPILHLLNIATREITKLMLVR